MSIKIVITTALAVVFCYCSKTSKHTKAVDRATIPAGVSENFKLVYTDSTKLEAILQSPIYKDFSNQPFKYDMFPKGLKIDFFDKENKTVITANYGIIYKETSLIELRGNVVIKTFDGKTLETDQLFWDQNIGWIFTDAPFLYTNPQEGTTMDGVGIDFSTAFKEVIAHKTNGVVFFDNN